MIMRIKILREAIGMSQLELAIQMGVLQSTVSNWESEVALPRSRILPDLASVLCCTINDLYVTEQEEAS